MIIPPARLAEEIGDEDLRVVDVRWYLADAAQGRREYDEGHLPSAVFCDVETHLTGRFGPGRHPLPRPEEFTDSLRRLGLDRGHRIVTYDDSGGSIAARLWWMLRSIGHERVEVLDGGFSAWVAERHPVTRAVPRVKPGSYPTALEWTGVVGYEEVVSRSCRLIDARAEERYRGEVEPIDPKAGHIPGAVNLPHAGNLRPNGRFLSPLELANRYADVGERPIVYCGSGVTGCHDLLAMAIAGRFDARLYEGSWSDWSRRSGAPIAIGPNP